jgi:hypothetical protein
MRGPGRLAAAILAAILIAGCGVAAPNRPVPIPSRETPLPLPTVSEAVAQTRLQVATALGAAGYQLLVPTQPFRPPESARLAAAPRAVFQVALPDDPTRGYIVIYEFVDSAQAGIAGGEMAAYLATGPGRIQFPADARYVLRQVDTTLIFYSWSPANSPGTDAQAIGQALETVGQGIEIPS